MSSIDNDLPHSIRRQVHCVLAITVSVIVIMTSLPQMLVVFVLLMTLYFYLKVITGIYVCSLQLKPDVIEQLSARMYMYVHDCMG